MLPGTLGGGFCHTPAVAISSRVAPRRAFELAALAEEVDAAEAHHIGLANRIIPQVARVAATKLPTSLVEPPWARTSSRHLLAPLHATSSHLFTPPPRTSSLACATHAPRMLALRRGAHNLSAASLPRRSGGAPTLTLTYALTLTPDPDPKPCTGGVEGTRRRHRAAPCRAVQPQQRRGQARLLRAGRRGEDRGSLRHRDGRDGAHVW